MTSQIRGNPIRKISLKAKINQLIKNLKKKRRISLLVSRFASKLMFISKIKKILKLPHGPVIYNFRIEIILCQKKNMKIFSGCPKRTSCCACAAIVVLIETFCKNCRSQTESNKNNGVIHIVTVFGVSVKKLITHMCVQFLVSKQFRIRVKHAGLFVNVFKVAKSLY